MKRILLAAAGLVLLLLPATSMAGVVGSDHDLQVGDTSGTKSVCYSCHVPHNAFGDKLWASAASGQDSTDFGDIGALCYTCHDGTVTSVGSGTVFNTSLQQHKSLSGSQGCSDAVNGCHDVHNQNSNGTGKFLVVSEVDGSYCVDCHDDVPFRANGLNDHRTSIGGNHQSNNPSFKCQQCHTAHGATAQGVNPGSLTNPILLADNHPTGQAYGAFCVSCHAGTAPSAAVLGSGGQAASDTNTYAQTTTDGSETSHPTEGGAASITGCNFCHDVHEAGAADSTTLLKSANANSAYCKSCHESGGSIPAVGGNSHPVEALASDNTMNGGAYTLPWAQSIDDDGNGVDYAGTTDNIVCETCHSVHRQGFTGADSENFLRAPNGTGNVICTQCHAQGQ